MPHSVRKRAEMLFTEPHSRVQQELEDKQQAQKARADQVARLRALREAKEATEAGRKETRAAARAVRRDAGPKSG